MKSKNINTIKEFLDGTHASQTKTLIYTGDIEKVRKANAISAEQAKIKRSVGDKWIETDVNGREWEITQHEGYRTKISSNSGYDTIREYLNKLETCSNENCETKQYNRLDKRTILKTGKCADCLAKYEDILRVTGKFKEYETEKLKQNAKSFFHDSDQYITELINEIRNGRTIVGEGGTTEVIPGASDVADKMLNDYLEFKDDVIKQLELNESN